jgi:hypothetical protein
MTAATREAFGDSVKTSGLAGYVAPFDGMDAGDSNADPDATRLARMRGQILDREVEIRTRFDLRSGDRGTRIGALQAVVPYI